MSNFRINETNSHFTANFYKDLGMDSSDINLLIYYVENKFQIQLQDGAEKRVKNMNQLVSMVYRAKAKQ